MPAAAEMAAFPQPQFPVLNSDIGDQAPLHPRIQELFLAQARHSNVFGECLQPIPMKPPTFAIDQEDRANFDNDALGSNDSLPVEVAIHSALSSTRVVFFFTSFSASRARHASASVLSFRSI